MKWRKLAHRATGLSDPVLLTLSARVQDPVLKVLVGGSPVNRICFKDVLASELVEGRRHREVRRVCVKNYRGVAADLTLLAEPPFRLDLSAAQPPVLDSGSLLTIPPHSHIQFDVILELSSAEVDRDRSLLIRDSGNVMAIPKSCELTLDQLPLGKNEMVWLDYKMIYPWFTISSRRLVFGPVLINHTTVKRLTIKALSGREKFWVEKGLKANIGERNSLLMDNANSAFRVEPMRAVLERNQHIDLYVYFTPTDSSDYLEVLLIKSSVEGRLMSAVVEGVGTWNHKFQPFSQNQPPLD